MKLTAVDVGSLQVDEALAFYGEIMGLPVDGDVVRVGESTLRLRHDPRTAGTTHLAFDVPAPRFVEARDWIASRAPLLAAQDGRTEFEAASHWNAKSVYFQGGGGEILELIARRDRPAAGPALEGAFSGAELLSISEVGVAVERPLALAEELRALGIEPYGAPGETFAPCGDLWGLLILAPPGRPWAPTADRPAEYSPVRVEAQTGRAGAFTLSPLAELVTG